MDQHELTQALFQMTEKFGSMTTAVNLLRESMLNFEIRLGKMEERMTGMEKKFERHAGIIALISLAIGSALTFVINSVLGKN
ncbi:MAG: hypothetical protein LBD82_05270 [Deltaproteobacteria bacterium]|jgi:hypothetical protein|nr:hypothetical protein [Deltaproteobacteria bacterium]